MRGHRRVVADGGGSAVAVAHERRAISETHVGERQVSGLLDHHQLRRLRRDLEAGSDPRVGRGVAGPGEEQAGRRDGLPFPRRSPSGDEQGADDLVGPLARRAGHGVGRPGRMAADDDRPGRRRHPVQRGVRLLGGISHLLTEGDQIGSLGVLGRRHDEPPRCRMGELSGVVGSGQAQAMGEEHQWIGTLGVIAGCIRHADHRIGAARTVRGVPDDHPGGSAVPVRELEAPDPHGVGPGSAIAGGVSQLVSGPLSRNSRLLGPIAAAGAAEQRQRQRQRGQLGEEGSHGVDAVRRYRLRRRSPCGRSAWRSGRSNRSTPRSHPPPQCR